METPISEWTVEAPWGSLSLTSWGNSSGPPVFLAHGRQDCSATFQPVLQLLPREYHYVGIDMPGSGNSDHLPVVVNPSIKFVALNNNSDTSNIKTEIDTSNIKTEIDTDSFNSDIITAFPQVFDGIKSTLVATSSKDLDKDLLVMEKNAEDAGNFEKIPFDPKKINNLCDNEIQEHSDFIFQCTYYGDGRIFPLETNRSFGNDLMNINTETSSNEVPIDVGLREFFLPKGSVAVNSNKTNFWDMMPKMMIANNQSHPHPNLPYHIETGIRRRRRGVDIAEFNEYYMENSIQSQGRITWIPDCIKCCLPCTKKQVIEQENEVIYDIVEFDEREHPDLGFLLLDEKPDPRQPSEPSVKIMRFHFLGAMEVAIEHLGWDNFIFIGHSMGCEIGLFYNAIYPNRITKMIFFDAEPTLRRLQVNDLAVYQTTFYDNYYNNYNRDNYHYKTYTILQATQALMKARNLTEDKASIIISKSLKHVKDDQYRFTWDHRLKLPAPQNYLNTYYFALFSNIPATILISASESLNANTKYSPGALELISMMETLKNFTHVTVEGDHDVHLSHPERVAPYAIDFLNKKNIVYSKL